MRITLDIDNEALDAFAEECGLGHLSRGEFVDLLSFQAKFEKPVKQGLTPNILELQNAANIIQP
jgi:hypothetical protein